MEPEKKQEPQPKKHRVMFVGVILVFIMILATGTGVYHVIEGWSYVDSFYFTSITMLTIGYGDLVPTSDVSKILTVLFSFVGVSVTLYMLFGVAEYYISRRSQDYYMSFYEHLRHLNHRKPKTPPQEKKK